MKKYTTTIFPSAIIFLICIFGFSFFGLMGADSYSRVVIGVGIFSLPFILGLILAGWLTYEKISDDGYLKHVVGLLFRRNVNIRSITHITQEGTYHAFQSAIKSIYIYYINSKGKERFLHLSMSLYHPKTLQRLLQDLLAINPNIKLDKKTEKLMKDYNSARFTFKSKANRNVVIGLSGAVFSLILFFVGMAMKDKIPPDSLVVLMFPCSVGLTISFIAFGATGKIKSALKVTAAWVLLLGVLIIFSFIR